MSSLLVQTMRRANCLLLLSAFGHALLTQQRPFPTLHLEGLARRLQVVRCSVYCSGGRRVCRGIQSGAKLPHAPHTPAEAVKLLIGPQLAALAQSLLHAPEKRARVHLQGGVVAAAQAIEQCRHIAVRNRWLAQAGGIRRSAFRDAQDAGRIA